MIGLETAKALKVAGLKWEVKKGDWWGKHYNVLARAGQYLITSEFEPLDEIGKEGIWLPSLTQLLTEIEGRGWTWALYGANDEGQYGIDIGQGRLTRNNMSALAASPEEAAAQALLWILKEPSL